MFTDVAQWAQTMALIRETNVSIPAVEYQNQRYQLDQSTWAHWPHAVVVRIPTSESPWQLFATPELLEQFIDSLEDVLPSDLSSDAGLAERVVALQALDYCVWSTSETIQSIADHSQDVGDLVALLEQWFFLKKI